MKWLGRELEWVFWVPTLQPFTELHIKEERCWLRTTQTTLHLLQLF